LYEYGDLPINLPPVSNPSSSSKTVDFVKNSPTSHNIDIVTASHTSSSDDRSFVVSPTVYSGVSRITFSGQHNPQKVEHSSSVNLPGDLPSHGAHSVDINRTVTSAFSLHQKKSLIEGSASFFKSILPGAKSKKKEKSVLHEISEETFNPVTQVGDWSKENIQLQKFISSSPSLELQQYKNESAIISAHTPPVLISPRAQAISPISTEQPNKAEARQEVSIHSHTQIQEGDKEPEGRDAFQTPLTRRLQLSQVNTATSLAWDSGDLDHISADLDQSRKSEVFRVIRDESGHHQLVLPEGASVVIQGQRILSQRESEDRSEQSTQSEASAPPAEVPEDEKTSSNASEHTEGVREERATGIRHESTTSQDKSQEESESTNSEEIPILLEQVRSLINQTLPALRKTRKSLSSTFTPAPCDETTVAKTIQPPDKTPPQSKEEIQSTNPFGEKARLPDYVQPIAGFWNQPAPQYPYWFSENQQQPNIPPYSVRQQNPLYEEEDPAPRYSPPTETKTYGIWNTALNIVPHPIASATFSQQPAVLRLHLPNEEEAKQHTLPKSVPEEQKEEHRVESRLTSTLINDRTIPTSSWSPNVSAIDPVNTETSNVIKQSSNPFENQETHVSNWTPEVSSVTPESSEEVVHEPASMASSGPTVINLASTDIHPHPSNFSGNADENPEAWLNFLERYYAFKKMTDEAFTDSFSLYLRKVAQSPKSENQSFSQPKLEQLFSEINFTPPTRWSTFENKIRRK